MSTTELCQSWQNSSLVAASMEDFESTSYTASVSRSPSRLQLKPSKTPIESIYTDMSVDSLQNSWSPPAWRKAGSGWFKQQTGTSSPVHSRTNSPVRNKGDFEEDNDMQDIDDAAEIPLPGSPTKGRSISRSLSPQRRSESPMRPAVIISPPSISCRTRCTESPEIHHVRQNNCKLINICLLSLLLIDYYRYTFLHACRCTTKDSTNRRCNIVNQIRL